MGGRESYVGFYICGEIYWSKEEREFANISFFMQG